MSTERADFEKWLLDVHGLDSVWNERRNCFDDFPAHLAFKAWQEAREQTIRECAEIAHAATMFTGCPLECMADEVRDAVLSLLQSKPGEGK